MTVHFIGAGPGAADLITVRGQRLIRQARIVLYAGSLVPRALIDEARMDARILDTSSMTLDEIIAEIEAAHRIGDDVARVHSGDPSIYGAIAEQMHRLDALGIPYDVIPGVPSFAAAAAALKTEFTIPELCQTVILTRTAVRASPMPAGEDLPTLAQSGATLAIHLSVKNLTQIVQDLTPRYGADCPAIVAWRVSWPDETIIRGTLADIDIKVKESGLTRTALILVGRALDPQAASAESRLYAPDHAHTQRPKRSDP
jgi:precorrin-4/cobalt-precorrin-4 C11-methyltransferase